MFNVTFETSGSGTGLFNIKCLRLIVSSQDQLCFSDEDIKNSTASAPAEGSMDCLGEILFNSLTTSTSLLPIESDHSPASPMSIATVAAGPPPPPVAAPLASVTSGKRK